MNPVPLGAELKLPPEVIVEGEDVILDGDDGIVEGEDVRLEGESAPEMGESPVTPEVSDVPVEGVACEPEVPPVAPLVPASPVDGDD
jgi:hypothetical protein